MPGVRRILGNNWIQLTIFRNHFWEKVSFAQPTYFCECWVSPKPNEIEKVSRNCELKGYRFLGWPGPPVKLRKISRLVFVGMFTYGILVTQPHALREMQPAVDEPAGLFFLRAGGSTRIQCFYLVFRILLSLSQVISHLLEQTANDDRSVLVDHHYSSTTKRWWFTIKKMGSINLCIHYQTCMAQRYRTPTSLHPKPFMAMPIL